MTAVDTPLTTLAEQVGAIGRDVAAPAADDVDAAARFPSEAIDALRSAGLLSVLVPTRWGGQGASLPEVSTALTALGRHCSSAAMVYAMHLIQIACLSRHGGTDEIAAFLERCAEEQLLLASATSEVGIGGDVRSSSCAVEVDGDTFQVVKQAPVISYGQHAAAVLVTARRTPESAPSDQVLVVAEASNLALEPTSGWDSLGFRGTCSLGFKLQATGGVGMICRDSYGDISAQTMLPVSHVVWASLWLGIAEAAADRARRYVQGQARKSPGSTPPGALRLAELSGVLSQFQALVADAGRQWQERADDPGSLTSISFAVSMNTLKVTASTLVVDIVTRALGICGMAGYANTSPFSLGRLLRDAHGAALMVNNDRVLGNTAQLVLGQRGS